WAPGDATWTEPTAIAVLALAAGGRRDTTEVRDGVEFLLDRAGPDGGWNIGNPFMLGKPMRSEVTFTGQTLLALRAAGARPVAPATYSAPPARFPWSASPTMAPACRRRSRPPFSRSSCRTCAASRSS